MKAILLFAFLTLATHAADSNLWTIVESNGRTLKLQPATGRTFVLQFWRGSSNEIASYEWVEVGHVGTNDLAAASANLRAFNQRLAELDAEIAWLRRNKLVGGLFPSAHGDLVKVTGEDVIRMLDERVAERVRLTGKPD